MRIPHILPCLVLLLAACTENLETNYITFRVSDEDYLPAPEVATRAVAEAPAVLPIESNLDEDLVLMTTIEDGINLPMQPATRGAQTGTGSTFAFGVSEYASNGTTAVTNFQNVQFSGTSAQPSTAQTVNSGKTWESDAANNAYRFFAYSPTLTTGTASNGLTLQSGNKTITYDCTSVSVANQQDLMTAHASSTYNSNGVALAFGHRLCAVKIQLAAGWNTSYTIRGVSFSSVVKSGTVSLADGSWSSLGAAGAYTPAGITETSSASGGVAVYLMMVPQTLSSCVMTVTLQKSGESYQSTLKATLNNNTWGAGQTVTYTISPSAITSVTVTYPASWSPTSGTTTITGPVTTYTTTDSFGLFAVDKDGKIVISNLQITAPTANAGSQTITLPSGPLYSQQYTYYIYYPYQSDLITNTTKYNAAGLAAGQTTTATTADTFFANVISGWTVATTQNSADLLKAQDLQVASGTSSFTMVHKMGLVKMTMGTATVVNTITFDGNTSTEKYRSSTTTSTTAMAVFDNFSPLTSSSTYYLIVKPSTAYSLNSGYKVTTTSGNPVYQWTQSITNSEITAGKYKACTPTPTFRNFARLYSYTGTGQTYTPIFANKKYFLECWGASGDVTVNTYYYSPTSVYNPHPGKGGYTYATTTLASLNALYVYVGSTGARFNGGSWGDPPGADATHIATANGKLSTLSGKQNTVLVVAGGAGGASDNFTSGHGGGSSGGNGTMTSGDVAPNGGSASSGGSAGYQRNHSINYWGGAGSFGQGGAGWVKTLDGSGVDISSSYSDPGGGGGGGWYGGGGAGSAGGGAGGSGHVLSGLSGATIAGNANVPDPLQYSTYASGPYEYTEYYFEGISGKTYASPRGHTGNGYARITVTPYD